MYRNNLYRVKIHEVLGAPNEAKFRKVRNDYLNLLGYYLCHHGHGQAIFDQFGRVVCDYTELPSFTFMEGFVRICNQQKPKDISLDFLEKSWKELEMEALEANYVKTYGLSWKTCKITGTLKVFTKHGKCVHDSINLTKRQINRFLNMSPEDREGIVQAFIEDTYFCFIEKMNLEYKCKLEAEYAAEEMWWDRKISSRMAFLDL